MDEKKRIRKIDINEFEINQETGYMLEVRFRISTRITRFTQ